MKIGIIGGSWITPGGRGTFFDGAVPVLKKGKIQFPPYEGLFKVPLRRYGRFDDYTKLGISAAAMALKEAGLDSGEKKLDVGFIFSSKYECFENDISFYQTTLEEGGSLSSPNLFSYTLPGIVAGECSVHFKLTGPTFCIGESEAEGPGVSALKGAVNAIKCGLVDTVLAGWLDTPPKGVSNPPDPEGAIFVLLTSRSSPRSKPIDKNLDELESIIDLFG